MMETEEQSHVLASNIEKDFPNGVNESGEALALHSQTPAQRGVGVCELKQGQVLFEKDAHRKNNTDSSDADDSFTKVAPGPDKGGQDVRGCAVPQTGGTPHAKAMVTAEQRKLQRAEMERLRLEAKARKEAEKLKKEQEKREKKERKETEKKQRDEEKRKKDEERKKRDEERREKRESERRLKEEERNKKDEERKRREHEKRKTELEREQVREEKERKKKLAKERFMGYFSKVDTIQKTDTSRALESSNTSPTARCARGRLSASETDEFDSCFHRQNQPSSDYLRQVKGKRRRVAVTEKQVTSPEDVAMEDVIISSPSASGNSGYSGGDSKSTTKSAFRFKLVQFVDNHRPAYYGTMRKKSKSISPRNPFRKDTTLLDYDVDSDEEWEEEEPGESVSDSEKEDNDDSGGEEAGEEAGEEDDGFFVPHGYLSEGEGEDSDEEMDTAEVDSGPITDDIDSRRRKKQQAKAKAWEAEFARKCQALKPIQFGCVWPPHGPSLEGEPRSKGQAFLQQFAAMALVELPIRIAAKQQSPLHSETHDSVLSRPVPEKAMPDLIHLVHGSSMGLSRLIKTFQAEWGAKICAPSTPSGPLSPTAATPETPQALVSACGISKRQLERKITAIATKEQRPSCSKPLWYVHDAVLQKYSIDGKALLLNTRSRSPPDTPSSAGVGVGKKGVRGPTVKSLFAALAKTPPVQVAVSPGNGSDVPPPFATSHSGGPRETKRRIQTVMLESTCTVNSTNSTPVHLADTKMPPTKKRRVELFRIDSLPLAPLQDTTASSQPPAAGQQQIVISDDSLSSDNTKENATSDRPSLPCSAPQTQASPNQRSTL